ncbi:uncharacterized protein LOC110732003 [Chenopodium quinoa]|uniref:uncharacterized protein LOC110732003 n=1 Tax=Chenopodium quinoa TaxID=63459 RepID=UPI000B78C38A|nr:uncharacterized protein LOC110732003 [Chenopodium quinoa]
MPRKKKSSNPLPQNNTHAPFDKILDNLRKSGFSSSEPIAEEDELVTPPPHLVHPSSGMISRGDLRTLERSIRGSIAQSQAQSNGTIPRVSAVTVPLVSSQNQSPIIPCVAVPEAPGDSDGSNHVSEAPSEGWKDLFKGKLNAKGTSLSFIAPEIRDGKSIAKLSSVDIYEGNKRWGNAIIFYVVGYSPTISAVHKFVADNWSNIAKPDIFWHDEGYFIINLKSIDDKNAILCSGPHMFFGKPAIVKAWSDKLDFHAEILRTVPLWIKLPNLPLNCWGAETLSRIGSLLGVPVCADECTSRQLRVSFARLLVEIDITKALPNSPQPVRKKQIGDPKATQTQAKKVWVPKKTQALAEVTKVPALVKEVTPTLQNHNNDEWQIPDKKSKKKANRQINFQVSSSNTYQPLTLDSNVAGVRKLLSDQKCDFLCLIETKAKQHNFVKIQKKFGVAWPWFANYANSPGGRIWIGWKVDLLNLTVLSSQEQLVHCLLTTKDLQTQIFITFVYGLHTVQDRLPLWAGLRQLTGFSGAWLCVGDFNSILSCEDRINGAMVTNYETKDFQNLIDDLALSEIKSKGSFFSWCNKAHNGSRTYSRIDRGIVNQDWIDAYGHVEAIYLPPSLSDHNPVLLDIFHSHLGKGRPFRFLNCLANHDVFLSVVDSAWQCSVTGSAM